MVPKTAGNSDLTTAFRWLGIAATSFTLFSDMRGAFQFAAILTPPSDGWVAGLKAIWSGLLPVPIARIDAVMLSVATFIVMNSVNAGRTPSARTWLTLPALAGALIVLIAVFVVIGFDAAPAGSLDQSRSAFEGLFDALALPLGEALAKWLPGVVGVSAWLVLSGLLSFIGLPAAASVVALPLAHRLTGVPFSLAAFTRRLWLILAALALLVAINAALVRAGL